MAQASPKSKNTLARRYFLGGSDARIIMGNDEAALLRLWREKRGEAEPEDLSSNLIVQLGLSTEELNRRWYQANTGQALTDVQRQIRHPTLRWMAATLDGRIEATGAVFEAKFMLPWSFSEEAAAEKYMPQLQHNMWVVAARSAVLSVITGGGKWVEITTHADPLYQHLIVTAERKFWRCVESGEPPRIFGVEPPKARIEALRVVDMSASNSLFTLVGIAGEDDLDAPDLTPPNVELDKKGINAKITGNGAQLTGSGPRTGQGRTGRSRSTSTSSELSAALSASLTTELLREIDQLSSADDAALWAHRKLAAKNQLSAADAHQVEQAFAAKLGSVAAHSAKTDEATIALTDGIAEKAGTQIDKSALAFPEPRRVRDRNHIRHVINQACLVCGRRPSDPHHLRFAQSRALGRKVSDEFTVPVCRTHHREIHRSGDEEVWWLNTGIDPFAAARALWLEGHPLARAEAISNEGMTVA
jgi:hypothetical protein